MPAENKRLPAPFIPCRLWVALMFGIILVGLVTVGTALFMVGRPHWRTLAVPGSIDGTRILVDCPDNWVPYDGIDYAQAIPVRHLELQPRPLTGLRLWWNEHIMRSKRPARPIHPLNEISIEVKALPASWHLSHPQWKMGAVEQSYREPTDIPGLTDSITRARHPLGPALRIKQERTTVETSLPDGAAFVPQHDESVLIYPACNPEIGHLEIVCSAPAGEYPRLKPVFDEVMRRIHLTRTAPDTSSEEVTFPAPNK